MSESGVESLHMFEWHTFRRKVRRYALEGLSNAEATKARALFLGIQADAKIERKKRGYVVHVTEYGDWKKVKRRKDCAK